MVGGESVFYAFAAITAVAAAALMAAAIATPGWYEIHSGHVHQRVGLFEFCNITGGPIPYESCYKVPFSSSIFGGSGTSAESPSGDYVSTFCATSVTSDSLEKRQVASITLGIIGAALALLGIGGLSFVAWCWRRFATVLISVAIGVGLVSMGLMIGSIIIVCLLFEKYYYCGSDFCSYAYRFLGAKDCAFFHGYSFVYGVIAAILTFLSVCVLIGLFVHRRSESSLRARRRDKRRYSPTRRDSSGNGEGDEENLHELVEEENSNSRRRKKTKDALKTSGVSSSSAPYGDSGSGSSLPSLLPAVSPSAPAADSNSAGSPMTTTTITKRNRGGGGGVEGTPFAMESSRVQNKNSILANSNNSNTNNNSVGVGRGNNSSGVLPRTQHVITIADGTIIIEETPPRGEENHSWVNMDDAENKQGRSPSHLGNNGNGYERQDQHRQKSFPSMMKTPSSAHRTPSVASTTGTASPTMVAMRSQSNHHPYNNSTYYDNSAANAAAETTTMRNAPDFGSTPPFARRDQQRYYEDYEGLNDDNNDKYVSSKATPSRRLNNTNPIEAATKGKENSDAADDHQQQQQQQQQQQSFYHYSLASPILASGSGGNGGNNTENNTQHDSLPISPPPLLLSSSPSSAAPYGRDVEERNQQRSIIMKKGSSTASTAYPYPYPYDLSNAPPLPKRRSTSPTTAATRGGVRNQWAHDQEQSPFLAATSSFSSSPPPPTSSAVRNRRPPTEGGGEGGDGRGVGDNDDEDDLTPTRSFHSANSTLREMANGNTLSSAVLGPSAGGNGGSGTAADNSSRLLIGGEGRGPPSEGKVGFWPSDWVFNTSSQLYWSSRQQLYLDPKSEHYFDPHSNKWYDPKQDMWYSKQ